jgi:transcriptional regulator with XRE-family HTH domain
MLEDPNVTNEERQETELPIDLLLDDNPELRCRIGRHLGGVRKQRRISQDAAAKGIGVSRPHLSNIELGRSRTSWAGLKSMAAYYELGIQQLIGECKSAGWIERVAVEAKMAPHHGTTRQDENLAPIETFLINSWRLLSRKDQAELMVEITRRMLKEQGQSD